MNPEAEYPELLNMKQGEIFVENASIWKDGKKIAHVEVARVINSKDKNDLAKGLKAKYDGDECYMITISKC